MGNLSAFVRQALQRVALESTSIAATQQSIGSRMASRTHSFARCGTGSIQEFLLHHNGEKPPAKKPR